MTDSDDDSFRLGLAWGHMTAAAIYDDAQDPPTWLLEVFHAMSTALENLPAEHRNPVMAAALDAWSKADH